MNDDVAIPEVLEAYLLGQVEFMSFMAWQRHMVYEISGNRSTGVLALWETPTAISIGRSGSREHIRIDEHELKTLGWPIHWVNRGGGCLLHTPGQLQVTAIFSLDALGLGLAAYLEMLHDVLLAACHNCDIDAETIPGRTGIWCDGRMLAHIGIAVHEWVAYFGAAINLDPDLELYSQIACDGYGDTMTSISRERRSPIRHAVVRQSLVELFADRFGFMGTAIFHDHHRLARQTRLRPAALRSA